MSSPKLGDRVFVCPAPGHSVQRGDGLFGQFIPPDGMECTWDGFLEQRQMEGAIRVQAPPVAAPPAEEVA